MKPDYDEALYRAAEEMFEFLAFLLVVPEEQAPPGDGEFVTVSVGFRGPMVGTLLLRISAETLPELGANMLGWAPDDALDRTLLLDALKELINVICGNLLPRISGTQDVFHVEPPAIRPEPDLPATLAGRPPAASARLALEVGSAELALFVGSQVESEPPAPAAASQTGED